MAKLTKELTKARDARMVAASGTLLRVLKSAQQLLRRKRLPAEQLVGAVRGLAAWPDAYGSTISALEIATMISRPAADATETTFAIVAKLHVVTPDKAKRVYRTWQGKQTRGRVLALR